MPRDRPAGHSGIVKPGFMNERLIDAAANNKGGDEFQERRTATLADVFSKFDVPKIIDYLSLDVEGAELFIMETFPFELGYRVMAMSVEDPKPALKKLLEERGEMKFVRKLPPNRLVDEIWVHKSIEV